MKKLAALSLLLLAACATTTTPPADHDYRVIAYVRGRTDIARIGAQKLTHINYAFGKVSPEGEVVIEEDAPAHFSQLNAQCRFHRAAPSRRDSGEEDRSRRRLLWPFLEGVGEAANGLSQPFEAYDVDVPYSRLVSEYFTSPAFERFWDAAARAPYLWDRTGRRFVTYDDPQSLREKARFVKSRGLGGVMYWEHSHDPEERLLDVLSSELR